MNTEKLVKKVNKIDNIEEQLDTIEQQKLDKNGIVNMANMGQDVKEAMTGGSVAVVGKNSVLNENIVDDQITKEKINDLTMNMYPFQGKAKFRHNKTSDKTNIIKGLVKDIRLFNCDLNDKYYISDIYRNASEGAYTPSKFIIKNSSGKEVCRFWKNNYTPSSTREKLKLSEQNGSGIHGYIYVNWSYIDTNTGFFGMDYEETGLSKSCLNQNEEYLLPETEIIPDKIKISIPSEMYGVVGTEINCYWDNIMIGDTENVFIKKYSGEGENFEKRLRYLPTSNYRNKTSFKVYDKSNIEYKELLDFSIIHNFAGKNSNNGVNAKCLFIGDSLIAAGKITEELINLFSNDVMNIKLLGTKGNGENKHEGRSGWSSYDYLTTSNFNNSTNAFLNNGNFDFSYYMTTNNIETPDWVFIQLGTNDTWRPMNGTTTAENYAMMINSIKSFNPNIKIGVVCTLLGAKSQDAWKDGTNSAYFNKKSILKIIDGLQAKFANKKDEGIYIVPVYTNIDTVNNFKTTVIPVNSRNTTKTCEIISDELHPADSGYFQVSDTYYCFLKNMSF